MSATGILSVAVGVVILGLTVVDIFQTVLHHWGKAGVIGRTITHVMWYAALRLTRRGSKANRRRLLGMVGPALIPVIVGTWAMLVVVGFAFLYLPGMPHGFDRWDRVLPVRGAFGDALYFSGYTFFTLGYGDIAPVYNTFRFLGIIQSGSGFAMITLVISYFVSVYDAYANKTVLAQTLHYQAQNRPDAVALICRPLTGGLPATALYGTLERLRDGLVRLRSDYSNYPILHFFRDPEPSQSFLRLLFLAQDLSLILDAVVDPQERPDLAGLGARSGLSTAAQAAQSSLVKSMVRQAPEELHRERSDRLAHEQAWQERCRLALRQLRECGIGVRPESEVLRDYCSARREWEPLLRACCDALGEPWDEVADGF